MVHRIHKKNYMCLYTVDVSYIMKVFQVLFLLCTLDFQIQYLEGGMGKSKNSESNAAINEFKYY